MTCECSENSGWNRISDASDTLSLSTVQSLLTFLGSAWPELRNLARIRLIASTALLDTSLNMYMAIFIFHFHQKCCHWGLMHDLLHLTKKLQNLTLLRLAVYSIVNFHSICVHTIKASDSPKQGTEGKLKLSPCGVTVTVADIGRSIKETRFRSL